MNKLKYLLLFVLLLATITKALPRDSVVNNSNSSDSLDAKTIKNKIAVVDTIKPVHINPFYNYSSYIKNNTIRISDFRYTGDIIKENPFNYTKDFGFVGQANITTLYGIGGNGINIMQNGILYNNRYSNFSDLNDIQSGLIDSIEIVPYTRGFLYSPYNNLVTVNILSRDIISSVPYSKIKFYQGPNGESLVDASFNFLLTKKMNTSFEITNRKQDDRFFNSNYSYWQATFNLKYIHSNHLNVIGSFNIEKSIVGLNGGVDVDSINVLTTNTDSLLYNSTFAPVNFIDRSKVFRTQNFYVKLLNRVSSNFKNDINFYYRFSNNKIAQTNGTPFINSINQEKVYGFSFNSLYKKNNYELNVLGGYESADIVSDSTINTNNINRSIHSVNYFASAILSTKLLNNKIKPAIYFKIRHSTLNKINNNISGFGSDIFVSINNKTNLYLGFSTNKNEYSDNYVKNFETRLSLKTDKFKISIGAFYRDNLFLPKNIFTNNTFFTELKTMKGVSAVLNFNAGKFSFENKGTYYKSSSNKNRFTTTVPEYTFESGLFYSNYVFENNMKLKAGFLVLHNGTRGVGNNISNIQTVSPFTRLDFKLSGIIQKVAIIYFTWENITNKKYFIIPYYPMPERNIRFGISWELFN